MQTKFNIWHISLCLAFGSYQKIYAEQKQPVWLQALVNKAIATTSETVTFTVILKTEDPYKNLQIPEFGDTIQGFRIENFGESPPTFTDDGQWESSRWYNLRADISGSYILPAISIGFDHEGAEKSVNTLEIFVEVTAPLSHQGNPAPNALDDIKDIKKIQAFPPNHSWIRVVAITIGFVLMGFGIFWWIMYRKSKPQPSIPPEVQALSKLEKLRNSNKLEKKDAKPFHFSISAIIRDYVESRFNFPASDKTLDEIQENIGSIPLSAEQRTQLMNILQMTDIVKFTDLVPDREKSQQLLTHTIEFINQTSPIQEAQDSVI